MNVLVYILFIVTVVTTGMSRCNAGDISISAELSSDPVQTNDMLQIARSLAVDDKVDAIIPRLIEKQRMLFEMRALLKQSDVGWAAQTNAVVFLNIQRYLENRTRLLKELEDIQKRIDDELMQIKRLLTERSLKVKEISK